MPLIKHKNPVEESFILWMSQYPESFHPSDMDRFYTLLKNICRYGASRWMNLYFLKAQILKFKPNFNKKDLEKLLNIAEYIFDYNKAEITPLKHINRGSNVKKSSFLEVSVKNGEIIEKNKPMNEF